MAQNGHVDENAPDSKVEKNSTNGDLQKVDDGTQAESEEGGQKGETIFTLSVQLPHKPNKIQIMVSSHEQIHEVRQTITEQPEALRYSCFHLEHNNERVNDFIQLSDVKDLLSQPQFVLVEDPYTEKEARLHVVRVRELVGAAGDRTDTLNGFLSGMSVYDSLHPTDEEHHEPATASKADTGTQHPLLDFDFQSQGSLATLLPEDSSPAPKTVKSLAVSPWNPPPYHLRQKGHLLYLQLTTNEGEQYQVTSHVSGFYVNKSSSTKFEPSPRAAPKGHAAHSLLSLLSELSISFDASFARLQEFNSKKEPLSTFQITNAMPANPWAVPGSATTIATHQSDLTRTQENLLISGVDNTESLRDWNEEFQSTRELPKDTIQDKVFRERLTSKLFADYNDAAARGAVLVARGEVAPLNPTEGRDAQIFVYNNVFFSFGGDGVGTFASEGGDEAARVATGKDVLGVQMVNQLDIDGLFTPGTVVIDYLGKRIVGQSIVPGIFKQREPGENQIDYGAVDGRDVIASDQKFVPAFEKLSKALKVKRHRVWDKSGTEHVLEGSVETKGLLGTDGRKYVLDLYRITPLDILWMEENGTALGSSKLTNGAVEAQYPHRMTVLRPELVEAFWKRKMSHWVSAELVKKRTSSDENSSKSTKSDKAEDNTSESDKRDALELDVNQTEDEASKSVAVSTAASDRDHIDVSKFSFSLNPDAFSGQEPPTEADQESWAADERDVRAACEFLRSDIISAFIHDLKEGDVGFPHDGQSLSRLLHRRGINIRYLGNIATLAEGSRLHALRVLAAQEMIARSFKHIAATYLRYLPIPFTSSCIAHLLNCLVGTGLNSDPVPEVDSSMSLLYPDTKLEFMHVSPSSLQQEIKTQTFRRYRYTLDESWVTSLKPLQTLREVSLKLGLQIEARNYHFSKDVASSSPLTPSPLGAKEGDATLNAPPSGGKKKGKAHEKSSTDASNASAKSAVTFCPNDVINIVPIIKEAAPRSALAEEALEAGRLSILQNQKKLGQELLLESLSLHEQIYGILHPEVARVYTTLSMLYYQLEEKEAAVELARKAVIVSERTIGVDCAETLQNYLNLGLFSHASGETKLALVYIRHALNLWKIVYGPNHPDSITTINNAAVMLQHLKQYHESRLWFEASLEICENVFGKQSINAATLLFQLAQALALDQESKGAVNRMRESYNIFLAELGAQDKNTKEAETWLEQLTQNAVSIAKHAKDIQARRVRAGIRLSPRVTLGQTHPQPQIDQTSQSASVRDSRNPMGFDSRSIDELLRYIEGGDAKSSKKRAGRSNPKRRGGSTVGTKA